jgi:hypothetical protein
MRLPWPRPPMYPLERFASTKMSLLTLSRVRSRSVAVAILAAVEPWRPARRSEGEPASHARWDVPTREPGGGTCAHVSRDASRYPDDENSSRECAPFSRMLALEFYASRFLGGFPDCARPARARFEMLSLGHICAKTGQKHGARPRVGHHAGPDRP